MDILGIGPLELFFIIVIALIVLGPKDMVKAGRTIGKNLKKVVSSENWRTIQQRLKKLKLSPPQLSHPTPPSNPDLCVKPSPDYGVFLQPPSALQRV
jgi:Sec-independent protein translocase protein TatA